MLEERLQLAQSAPEIAHNMDTVVDYRKCRYKKTVIACISCLFIATHVYSPVAQPQPSKCKTCLPTLMKQCHCVLQISFQGTINTLPTRESRRSMTDSERKKEVPRCATLIGFKLSANCIQADCSFERMIQSASRTSKAPLPRPALIHNFGSHRS